MSFSKEKREAIMFEIAKCIKYNPSSSVLEISKQVHISKQTAYKYIKDLVNKKALVAKGERKGYRLPATQIVRFWYPTNTDEDIIYYNDVKPLLSSLNTSSHRKFEYAVQEMLNNAKDHSNGTRIGLIVQEDYVSIRVIVMDNGIGIFKKIQDAFHLNSINDAILELDKGKLTTDEEKHSGEGIFFSSKMFKFFFIQANNLTYIARNDFDHSLLLEKIKGNNNIGTYVSMELAKDNNEDPNVVFARFNDTEDYNFNKTIVSVIHLLDRKNTTDMTLISRSQARRLLNRFDKFKEVMLDFSGIEAIGQGFADEIFRVYKKQHPDIHIAYLHANSNVTKMILHAMNTSF